MASYKAKKPKSTTANRAAASMWFDDASFYDAVKSVEKVFGRDSAKVYDKAFDRAMALPEEIMRQWFSNTHHRTGRTEKAYIPGKTVSAWDKDVEGYMYYRAYGYDKKKAVTPVFFEYGTPRRPPYRIEPEFVIYYAVRDFKDVIRGQLIRTINDEFFRRQAGGGSE